MWTEWKGRTHSHEGLQMFCFFLCLFPRLFGSDRNTSATNSLSAFVWFSMTDFVLISNCSLSTMYWKSFPKKSCVKIWVKGNVRCFWYGMETLLFGRAAVWLSLTVSVICGFLGSVSITFQNSSNQTWYFNASFRKHWRQLAVIWKRNWCSVWKLKSYFFSFWTPSFMSQKTVLKECKCQSASRSYQPAWPLWVCVYFVWQSDKHANNSAQFCPVCLLNFPKFDFEWLHPEKLYQHSFHIMLPGVDVRQSGLHLFPFS